MCNNTARTFQCYAFWQPKSRKLQMHLVISRLYSNVQLCLGSSGKKCFTRLFTLNQFFSENFKEGEEFFINFSNLCLYGAYFR